ncbi:MAG TPA: aconitate hydratase AcnA [Candidatus Thermoplasmatota archaeon]|nr:aconitate hydratase AcnA [Candidatus Thermoplasmatota archaeon]
MVLRNTFGTLATFDLDGERLTYYSLPALERALGLPAGRVARLPVSIRIVLESLLRNCDGNAVREEDVRALAGWDAHAPADREIPFKVARVIMQDFTGVPAIVDLAAMRDAVQRAGKDPSLVDPLVPVELVIDHSVQVDYYGTADAFQKNVKMEFGRNVERYEFLKWGQQAFRNFDVVPPGIGIVHQVNLEHLAKAVFTADAEGTAGATRLAYPDTLVGTDSHTTMINGLGIVGWGVGGIEAEAGMLGQPVAFLTPRVFGVRLDGRLKAGVTATDLVLTVTQKLRAIGVVGQFVEFYGEGARSLTVADRATLANMSPEYGATMGFFPTDEETLAYLRATGRDESHVRLVEAYYKAQGMFGVPLEGDVAYSDTVVIDLAAVEPSVAGPKLPQDRVSLSDVKRDFRACFEEPATGRGFGMAGKEFDGRVPVEHPPGERGEIGHGTVVIAAITSCTNTSNPSVMIAAGLLAQRAVERGLRVPGHVKTSLAPGSRVVSRYLEQAGLLTYLEKLGFAVVGYGCTTCIGNAGPLPAAVSKAVVDHDLVVASVLSGNRNFEARIHPDVRANYLMSPPLVVAYALAGSVNVDLTRDPLGHDARGAPVFLRDLWPSHEEVLAVLRSALVPLVFREMYTDVSRQSPIWTNLQVGAGKTFPWRTESTYIQEPPFFTKFDPARAPGVRKVEGARPLIILGDNVTTDHISPAGGISDKAPAGQYLLASGVRKEEFNQYGTRRGNDRVMTRGTFANTRIKNQMVPGVEGGVTRHMPDGTTMSVYDAAMRYEDEGVPLVVFAGKNYGTGSSRDWAAKGTKLLGVRAVVAESYERIHRSNLVGMGVLPLQFPTGVSANTLGFDGREVVTFRDLDDDLKPGQPIPMDYVKGDGSKGTVTLTARVDTPIEVEYMRAGGILDFVLRNLLKKA